MYKVSDSVLKEVIQNRKRIPVISFYNLLFQYNQTTLKLLWTILNPVLQVVTYWLTFHVGLKANSPVDGIPYLNWMLVGLIPWFYLSAALNMGSGSILSYAGIVKSMKFPISIIPVCTVLTELMAHLCFVTVLVIINLICGIPFTFKSLLFLYYTAAGSYFLIAYTYFMSTVTVFFRDIQKLIPTVVRLLFFFTPICWSAQGTDFEVLAHFNPFMFIIDGYRDTLLFDRFTTESACKHLMFWLLCSVCLVAGALLHRKTKMRFSDYL